MQSDTAQVVCTCGGTEEEPPEPTAALLRHIEDVADGVRDSSKQILLSVSLSLSLYVGATLEWSPLKKTVLLIPVV